MIKSQKMNYSKLKIYIIILFSFFCLSSYSVENSEKITIVKGVVLDAESGESLPFAGVSIEGKNIQTTTDLDGNFTLVIKDASNKLKISSVGFEPVIINISVGKTQSITVKLKPEIKVLNDVIVRPKKEKYRNKNNPAVQLIENVIANKDKNMKEALDYYEYEKYEKTIFALSNITDDFKKKKIFKKFQFVFDNLDTTKIPGKEVLPMYIKESISDFYFKKPRKTKEIIKANKMVSFEGYVDNQGVASFLKYLYQDINIYDNNITLLSNQFLSPISGVAPTFYKYFIMDTTIVNNSKCVRLAFFPRNKTDFLFQGNLYVMLDSSFAIKKVDMTVNKDINLNWVKDLKIEQEFEKIQNQGWMLTTDLLAADFGVTQSGLGIYGERTMSYKNYLINFPHNDSLYSGLSSEEKADANSKSNNYWFENRHVSLSKPEQGTYTVIDSVKRMPAFKRAMDIMVLLIAGYKDAGYFEIGPVNTFYSYNPIEGFRLRFGGRTTPKFSKRLNFETYVAYGFTDEKYKYYLGATYSLTPKTIYEFPVKYVKLSYQDETKIPGQDLQFIQEDNILLSIKRGVNNKMFYNKTLKFEHLNEFPSHFSYTVGYQYLKQLPAGDLYFNSLDYALRQNTKPFINVSEACIGLRYAPNEQFYQGKLYRTPVINQYPVFQLQYNAGLKLINNDYNYQNLRLTISKRFYFSVLGYSDVILEGGKIFGQVPYPLLFVHRANQTYSYQIMSYNLMNFLEFVSDEYASLNVDHCFNGFFFNKIPLFKRLKFREVASCKILYGGVSNQNNPSLHSNLFKFPVDINGAPLTYTLEQKPYIETSIGVGNIFKLFRVDWVQRLTYLNHPNVSPNGIRVRFKLDF